MSQITKCAGYKKDGTKCTRNAQLNSDFCWQHQTQLEQKWENNSALIPDLEDITYSYLTLEEILTSFKDDLTLRDKLVERYYPNLPTIEESSKLGDFETIKYLISVGIKPRKNTMLNLFEPTAVDFASANGYLEIVKYLTEIGADGTINGINWAAKNGHLEVVKYLISTGWNANAITITYAAGTGQLDVIKYLVSLGVKPNGQAIQFAEQGGHLETAKYLKSVLKKS